MKAALQRNRLGNNRCMSCSNILVLFHVPKWHEGEIQGLRHQEFLSNGKYTNSVRLGTGEEQLAILVFY